MSIYKMSKIVLALLIAGGCITTAGAARAADETKSTSYTYTFTPYKSNSSSESSPVTAATVSVSVSTTTSSYTYTDANGNQKTITYTTLTEATSPEENPSVSVEVTDVTSLNLSYDSPNATAQNTGSIEKIYYAWTEDGFVQVKEADGQYSYTVTVGDETTTKTVTAPDVTVSYVTSDENTDGNTETSHKGITNDGGENQTYEGQNISADFVADHHNESTVQGGGAIFNYGENASVSLKTITGNFIGNYETNSSNTGDNNNMEGGAITNFASTSSYTATIEAIAGNFVGNYVEVANDGTTSDGRTITGLGGAISNYGNATIKSITGDFIGNHVTATQSGSASETDPAVAIGGAISNYRYSDGSTVMTPVIEKIDGNFIGNYVESSGGAAQGRSGGGAIYNTGFIGKFTDDVADADEVAIAGSFIGNYAKTTQGGYAFGGAIFNSGSYSKIGNIRADFIGNYAEATSSGAYGGAIFNEGTIADVGSSTTKSNFIGNSVNTSGEDFAQGGAIYNTGTFGDITADFIGNSATTSGTYALGGAINNNNGTINSLAGDFIGNSAKSEGTDTASSYAWGGAIYNTGKIGYVDETGTPSTKVAITGNFISNTAESQANDSYGGAIYNNGTIGTITTTTESDGSESVSVTIDGISDSTFISNTAARGGAIYNGTDKTTAESGDGGDTGDTGTTYTGIISSITNTQFIQNVATRYGGAIYNYADGAIYNIAKNQFIENEATDGNGGAIENAEKTSYIGAITENYFIGNKVTKSDHGGGAIYSEGKIDSLTNNVFVENESGNFGGAIYNHGGTIGTTDESGNVTGSISGNTFQGNTSGRGGAIYNTAREITNDDGEVTDYEKDTGNITSISNNYFVKNVATAYGGAIYNYHGASIGEIVNNYFIENEAKNGNGGAIENAESDAYIGSITGNVFSKNKVTESDHGGGAIYNEGIIGDLTGNTFEENSSGNFGGAIYNHGGTIGTIGGTVTTSGNTTTYSSAFTGNTSARGGAIYNVATEVTGGSGTTYTEGTGTIESISGNYFQKNIATAYGGAIYNYHGGTIGEISSNYFEANEAKGGNGGAVENAESDAVIGKMDGNTFVNNKATGNGGAIYNEGTIGSASYTDSEGKTVNVTGGITDSTFSGNEAASGGAIYNAGSTTGDGGTIASITGSTFTSNSAKSTAGAAEGGAIYNAGTIGEIEITTLSGNTAEGATSAAGGAIYNSGTISKDGSSGTISVGLISSNYAKATGTDSSATAQGGAIYNSDASAEIAVSGTIASNYAEAAGGSAQGGAIYTKGAVTVTEDESANLYIQENHATATGSSGSAQGGAIYSEGALNVTATSLYKNYASGTTSAAGGAIYHSDSSGSEGKISVGTISSNYAKATDTSATGAAGGAIYNSDASAEIAVSGSIASNYADATGGDAQGGAIYTKGAVTVTENGESVYIQQNYATTTSGDAQGGAIYSEGTLNVTATSLYGNYAKSSSGEASGGAIYNTGTLESIALTYLSNNYAEGTTSAAGGGIYNSVTGSSNGKISVGTISTNHAKATGGAATGGAIYNSDASAEIDVSGSIASNYAEAAGGSAQGGAIYTKGDVTVTEDESANLYIQENHATATGSSGSAQGGAIYSEGTLNVTATSLYGNYASGTTSAAGGAIYHSVTDSEETGEISVVSISNNHATASGSSATAQGGAIYNDDANTTVNVTGSITGNYAQASNGTAQGGAIYTNGDVNVTADSSTILIRNNYAQSGSTKDENAIYMNSATAAVNFSLSNKSSIYLYDNIQGTTGYGVNISGDGLENVFYLLNDVEGSNLSVGASLTSPNLIKPLDEPAPGDGDDSETETVTGNLTLSTTLHDINSDEVHTYKVNSFTVAGNFNMEADVDLKTETMDHFETEDGTGTGTLTGDGVTNGHAGNLNVSDMFGLSDTDKDEVAVYFAETGLMENVTSSVSTLVAPVHEYSVAYVYKDDSGIHHGDDTYEATNSTVLSSSDNGGYFVFSKSGFSSSVMTPSIAVMGAYGAFSMMFDYNFEHSDYYMKLPENVRLAMSEESENAEKAPKENDATRPEYYNQHELTYHGAWSRTFFSNESIDYGGGWDSRDKYYGAMFGFDTDMKFHDNGWANVTTGYVGTMGIRQQFSGGHIKQHGGFVGVTESFYKKNFYNAWTIAAGFTKAHEHTMYGHDKDRIDEYGIATRLGWNIRLGHDEKFTLLPTFTASFSYIHPEDFSNAANVHIAGSGFRAVQLNPNVKLLWNRDDGWQPYLTVGEVWTVADSLHLRANGEKLPELDLDPYTEYGIGVQKRWAYDRDAYIQFLGHSHGRDGFLVNAGIRWNF